MSRFGLALADAEPPQMISDTLTLLANRTVTRLGRTLLQGEELGHSKRSPGKSAKRLSGKASGSGHCRVMLRCANLQMAVGTVGGGGHSRCKLRHAKLSAAERACAASPRCGGITRDAGMPCGGAVLRFELRSGSLDKPMRLGTTEGLFSWVVHHNVEKGSAECKSMQLQESAADAARCGKVAQLPGDQGVSCEAGGAFVLDESTWPAKGHFLDAGLADFIAQLAGSDATILDVGAGSGMYGAHFHKRRREGRAAPIGASVEGAANVASFTRRMGPPGAATDHLNMCNVSDLARRPVYDWVMSLEVGEHLPTACLSNFLALLHHSNRRGIVLSWAVPGQPGVCHINGRTRQQVLAMANFLGYEADEAASSAARQAAKLSWLKNNVLVLRRPHPPPPPPHSPPPYDGTAEE